MRTLVLSALAAAALAGGAPALAASGGGVKLDPVATDIRDRPSLQRGWATYMDYCFGCHSLRYARYQRTAEDLGVPPELLEKYILPAGQKAGMLMKNAIPAEYAEKWFGVAPPDLTLVARSRSPDWIYTYLRSFYADDKRTWGVNNRVFPDVGMPHALLELEGLKACAPGPVLAPNGGVKRDPLTGEDILEDPCGRFTTLEPGRLGGEEYDALVADLVNFLTYIAEPAALVRYRIGAYVMLFLAVLLVFSWLLKREYWRDVK